MRSVGRLAAIGGTLVFATACGEGGSLPTENAAPVANFVVPSCTVNVPCDFVSTSTDNDQVTAWRWDLDGDGDADATTANASFIYSAATDFDVSLTVFDAENLSQTKTSTITIAPATPTNTAPTAGFTATCNGEDCSFISTSSDAAPGTIATYAWDFGDGGTANVDSPTHTYTVAAPTDFTVTLTVTDNEGATDIETQPVSVTPAPPPNTPPTAGFTYTCSAADCSFSSTSSDAAPGAIASHAWDFGDGATEDVSNPSHRYAIINATDFTVTLTVTDDQGATDVETQTITVSPPPPGAEGCTTRGRDPLYTDCLLDIAELSNIKLKLIGVSCNLNGQRVQIPPPSSDGVFQKVCLRAVGDSTRIFGGPGDSAFVYQAGSQVTIRFIQGTPARGAPTPGVPAAQVTGTFPNWTINFEDGGNPGGPGEPDFTDVVLQVEAVPPKSN